MTVILLDLVSSGSGVDESGTVEMAMELVDKTGVVSFDNLQSHSPRSVITRLSILIVQTPTSI